MSKGAGPNGEKSPLEMRYVDANTMHTKSTHELHLGYITMLSSSVILSWL